MTTTKVINIPTSYNRVWNALSNLDSAVANDFETDPVPRLLRSQTSLTKKIRGLQDRLNTLEAHGKRKAQ